ncbi:SDR family oxidoreductase [Candidatus Berkiella aquae]|uniref:Glucose 1-dehydrogenase 2 n=1 Tax=Candidatus Berkiella aquae TaxID=295108 RepID=A0A0Q9YYV5_9GAMM|nr:SDR family oxidoreductase [Candidatus Berkiella aquae]MCS5711892.1 SDR family oxidoreductase [Candidatus Berkiella aquae]
MQNRVAIVTGGAQGIGKAITKEFLIQKMTVIVVDEDKTAGKELQNEYATLGSILFYPIDINKENEIKKLNAYVKKHFGKLDALVNNAGIFKKEPIENLSLKKWQQILNTNLTSVFLMSKYFTPLLKKSHGSIINIASTRALMSEPHTEAYAASKGGIVALTHAMAISLGPEIRVNCISPGWIETSEWQKSSHREKSKHSKEDKTQHPVGRVGNPEDIASLVLYLSEEKASFITGANFVIDGGMTRKMIYV